MILVFRSVKNNYKIHRYFLEAISFDIFFSILTNNEQSFADIPKNKCP